MATGRPWFWCTGSAAPTVNWMGVGALLTRRARVVAIDLPGFGRTPTEGGSASIHASQVLLDRFLEKVIGTPAILVGNSMGGLIAMMQAAERPAGVAGLVLVGGAMPASISTSIDAVVATMFAAYLLPLVGELFMHGRKLLLGPEGSVKQLLDLCCVDASRVAPEIVAASIELSRERLHTRGGNAAFLQAARSLVGFLARRGSFEAMVRRIAAPTLILHGAEDRLVPAAAARALHQLRPDWQLEVLQGLGHVPQLEDPTRFVAVVESWLDGEGRATRAVSA